jgi:MoaA/NifB/PqqE/SkfB family radical SAM enzyme
MKKLIFTKRGNFLKVAFSVMRWHLDHYVLKRPSKPLVVGVFLTNKCNLHCEMCSIWRSQKKAELTLEDIVRLVDRLTPGCCYFSFSGGEPLLVKEIVAMVDYAARKIPYVHLVSNGLVMNADYARRLAGAGLSEISLSLDGEESYHNELRGNASSYAKVIEAIETITKETPDLKIVLNTVLFPGRLEQARHVIELAGKMGIYAKVQPVNRHFSFADAPHSPREIEFDMGDPEELREFVDYLSCTGHVLNSGYYLSHMLDYFSGKAVCPLIRPRCRVPHYFLEANPHGIISPCMYGTGWEKGIQLNAYDERNPDLISMKKELEHCRLCDETMYICYWEALINMPVFNYIKHTIFNYGHGKKRKIS